MKDLVGFVVPTLGSRNAFLIRTLTSIRTAGCKAIVLVTPDPQTTKRSLDPLLFDQIIEDPRDGLASAINIGVAHLPRQIEYFNWLGDDDLLHPLGLEKTLPILVNDPSVAIVFGMCNYIDDNDLLIWQNRSGNYAKWLMKIGPQLISQPSVLIRRVAFENAGGLSRQYNWAFDLDLFLRISKRGRLVYIPEVLGSFRWHSESLTVKGRFFSAREASRVRRESLPVPLRLASTIWEPVLRRLIIAAGQILTKRSPQKHQFQKDGV